MTIPLPAKKNRMRNAECGVVTGEGHRPRGLRRDTPGLLPRSLRGTRSPATVLAIRIAIRVVSGGRA